MNDVEIEVDIFSGRPNPTWRLSQQEAQLLSTMLEQLSSAEPQDLFEGLGYRGFVVTSGKPLAGATTIRVFKGIVKFGVGDGASYSLDGHHQIESWLLARAKSSLSAEDYKVIASEITSHSR